MHNNNRQLSVSTEKCMRLLIIIYPGILYYHTVPVLMYAVGDGVLSYRPVIMMHGLTGVPESMDLLKERILNLHPGTPVHIIDAYNSGVSM